METIEIVTPKVTTEEKLDVLNNLRNVYNELMAQFEAKNADLIEQIGLLEAEIKNDVLECGATVKGESLMACWVSGKTTWDGKRLKCWKSNFLKSGSPRRSEIRRSAFAK